MADNKHALIRFRAIDQLLASGEPCTIEQMRKACSDALASSKWESGDSEDDKKSCVSRVTVYSDIKTLENEWHVSICKTDTRPVKYYYAKGSLTMNGTKISDDTYDDVRYALQYLESVSGLLKADNAVKKLHSKLENLGEETRDIIGFASNPSLKNSDRLWEIYRYIRESKPLMINYNKAYEQTSPHDVQPLYLKQYRNRWFLVCWKYDSKDSISGSLRTLALDRMEEIKINRSRNMMPALIYQNDFDANEYFKDIIGVTKFSVNKEQIVLKANLKESGGNYDFNRMVTKPLHHSQSSKVEGDYGYIYLSVYPNNELYSELLAFESLEIVEPENVRASFIERLISLSSHYPEFQAMLNAKEE